MINQSGQVSHKDMRMGEGMSWHKCALLLLCFQTQIQVSVQGKTPSGSVDQGVSDLSSQSSDAGLTRQQIAQRRAVSEQYDVVEGSKQNPHTLMFEYSILDGLKSQEDDSPDTANMKSQVRQRWWAHRPCSCAVHLVCTVSISVCCSWQASLRL